MPFRMIGSDVHSPGLGEVVPGERGRREHVEERLDGGARQRRAQVVAQPAAGERGALAGDAGRPAATAFGVSLTGGAGSAAASVPPLAEAADARDPLAHELLEDRVARVLRDAHAARERQVGEVEVARAPAEQVGVERHDDRFAAGCLGPAQQRGVEVVGGRPVELEQPRSGRRGIAHLLHRDGCLIRERVRDAEGCRGPRHGEVGVGVGDLHDAERREQERRRAARAEEVDRQVARRDVAQRPRPHLPAIERGAVGGDRALGARSARDVGERLGAQRLAGGRFEGVGVDGHAGRVPLMPAR